MVCRLVTEQWYGEYENKSIWVISPSAWFYQALAVWERYPLKQPKTSYWTTWVHSSSPEPPEIIQSVHLQNCLACLPCLFLPRKTTIKSSTPQLLSGLILPRCFPLCPAWQSGLLCPGGYEYSRNFFLRDSVFCVCVSYPTCSTNIQVPLKLSQITDTGIYHFKVL